MSQLVGNNSEHFLIIFVLQYMYTIKDEEHGLPSLVRSPTVPPNVLKILLDMYILLFNNVLASFYC